MKHYYKDLNFKKWNYFYYTLKTSTEQNSCGNTKWISSTCNLQNEISFLMDYDKLDKIGFNNIFIACTMKKELL